MTDIALASAVHDPEGRTVPALERLADRLTATFSAFAFNVSDATAPAVAEAARTLLGAEIVTHPASEATIGKVRREAVALALSHETILYSDPDHLLRWIEHAPENLDQVLRGQPEVEFLVIGRSPAAFAAGPQRLYETERLVNHVHRLMTGEDWDLLFAIRRMHRRAAEIVVSRSQIDTLANDAEWPLLAREAGLHLGYAESDALFYRTIHEFGAPADSGDGQPLQWIRRLEFAGLMASAMRPYLK